MLTVCAQWLWQEDWSRSEQGAGPFPGFSGAVTLAGWAGAWCGPGLFFKVHFDVWGGCFFFPSKLSALGENSVSNLLCPIASNTCSLQILEQNNYGLNK